MSDSKISNLVDQWVAIDTGRCITTDRAEEILRVDGLLAQIGDADELRSLIKQGVLSRRGASKPRSDLLSDLILATALGLLNETGTLPTAEETIMGLWRFDSDNEWEQIVQEIDGAREEIYWIDGRGREQTTTFRAFKKRYSRLSRNGLLGYGE